jgi:hypothetical protein
MANPSILDPNQHPERLSSDPDQSDASSFRQDLPAAAGPIGNDPNGFGRRQPDQPFRPHRASPVVRHLTRAPRVLIAPAAYRKMLLYVERAPLEVGWMGTVTRRGNDFVIDRVYLLKQTVSAVTTAISVQGQDDLCQELLKQGQSGVESLNNLRFWGHSHVRMDVEASERDEMTMREFENNGLPWALRGIFNKLGRAKFSLFLYEEGLRVDDVPWAVYDPASGGEIALSPAPRSLFQTGHALFCDIIAIKQAPGFIGPDKAGPDKSALDKAGANSDLSVAFANLPIELQPDAALRAEVSADYAAKVVERDFRGLAFFSRSAADNIAADNIKAGK